MIDIRLKKKIFKGLLYLEPGPLIDFHKKKLPYVFLLSLFDVRSKKKTGISSGGNNTSSKLHLISKKNLRLLIWYKINNNNN